MNQNYNLIKSGMIDFEKVLIEKYSFIGLNEVEVVTLIKLQNFLKQPSPIAIDTLPSLMHETMSKSIEEISELIAKLIEGKYIDLLEQNGSFTYSLDPTYKRVANILDNENEKENKENNTNDIKKIVALIEKNFNSLVSPLELNMITRWVNVDNYSYYDINEAIVTCLQRRNKSVKLINEILRTKKEKELHKVASDNSDLKKMFNSVYGKKDN